MTNKFKGESTYNGEEVYGDLIHYKNGEMAIIPHNDKLSEYGVEASEIYKRVKVEPKTVKKYIGREDKNGCEIYEQYTIKGELEEGLPIKGFVKYSNKLSCYVLVNEVKTPLHHIKNIEITDRK